jgi:L,D-transpeptidase ErfK/SrfK
MGLITYWGTEPYKMMNLGRLKGTKYNIVFISALLGAASAFAAPAGAGAGLSVDGDLLLGQTTSYTVKKHETLFDIARRYDMGIIELEAANPGVSPWNPKAGTSITVTTKHVIPSITHDGIVVNLSASRLYYFKGPREVLSFPIASGKSGWETPVAATTVIDKRIHPTWTPPPNIRAENPKLPPFIPPGPDNPLGDYAMALGVGGIMIHGTNAPASIGKHASHGCIRMYPEDIKALFNAVPLHTPVLLTRTPYVMGWQGRTLYIEVTPRVHPAPPRHTKTAKAKPKVKSDPFLHRAVTQVAGAGTTIDWTAVDEALARGDGIPTAIATRSLFVGPPAPVTMTASVPEPVTETAPAAVHAAAAQTLIQPVAHPSPAVTPVTTPAVTQVPSPAATSVSAPAPAVTPISAPAPVLHPVQHAALTLIND